MIKRKKKHFFPELCRLQQIGTIFTIIGTIGNWHKLVQILQFFTLLIIWIIEVLVTVQLLIYWVIYIYSMYPIGCGFFN